MEWQQLRRRCSHLTLSADGCTEGQGVAGRGESVGEWEGGKWQRCTWRCTYCAQAAGCKAGQGGL